MKKFTFLFFGLYVLLAAKSGFAQIEPTKVVILFGDSITATRWAFSPDETEHGGFINGAEGKWVDGKSEGGWVAGELKRLIVNSDTSVDNNTGAIVYKHSDITVYNYGNAGKQSSYGADYTEDTITPDTAEIANVIDEVKARQPYGNVEYTILIAFGTNDFGSPDKPVIDASDTEKNIELMIDIALDKGVTPVVGNIIPRNDGLNSEVQVYNTFLKNAVDDKRAEYSQTAVGFVDHHSVWVGKNLLSLFRVEDSLHPDDCGSRFIAQTWYQGWFLGSTSPSNVLPSCDSAPALTYYLNKAVQGN